MLSDLATRQGESLSSGVALGVSFQQVVHSVPAEETGDCQIIKLARGTEWTSMRMPV